MSGRVGDLSDEQLAVLDEFRASMDDILRPHHDDYYLSRWLRAKNYNLTEAVTMLRTSLQWRNQIKADTLIDEYDPPEVLLKYFPGGLIGHDKEGCPIWIIPFGNMDIKGLFYSVKKSEFIKYIVKLMESSEQEMRDQSERMGKVVDTHSIIFDLENLTMKQVAWKPAIDMITHLVKLFEDNYPERLKKAYVINVPKFFPVAYALVKPVLSDETAKKIHVYMKETWKAALLEDIDSDTLPVHWGGNRTDDNDDPKVSTIICQGGAVPCSSYTAPSRRLSIDQNMTSVVVEKKAELPIEFQVIEPGSVLQWEFQTEDYDIGFGVYCKPEDGEQKELIPIQRVNCHLVPEDGMVVCDTAGTYILKFDNSFSWCRRKRLMYRVEVMPPTKKEEVKEITQNSENIPV